MSDDKDNATTPGKVSYKTLLSAAGGSGTLIALITFAVNAYNDAQDKWEARYNDDQKALHSKIDDHRDDLEEEVEKLKKELQQKRDELNALNASFVAAAAKVQGDQAQWKQIKANEEEIDRIKYERRLEKELRDMSRKKDADLEKEKESFIEKWMKMYKKTMGSDGAHLNPAPAPKPHSPTSLTDKEYIEHKLSTLHDE